MSDRPPESPRSLMLAWLRPLTALLIGGAVVAAAALLAGGVVEALRIHHAEKRITVTGSATRRVRSDLVVWRATVRTQAPQMAEAYKRLAADVPAVVAFIKQEGVEDKDLKVAAATVQEIHPRDKDDHEIPDVTSAFVTEQQVEVTSTNIDRVERNFCSF